MRANVAAVVIACLLATRGASAQPPQLRKADIGNGVSLHYVEQGQGEPIVFIHGLTGDYSIWTQQLDAFAKEGYRAISYSRRYNYPNKNPVRPNHSASVEADDLAALLRELEIADAHIVGHSFGGYTALLLALKEPALVRTLTLAEPPIAPWLRDMQGPLGDQARAHSLKLFNEGVLPARAAFASGNDDLAIQKMLDAIGGAGSFKRLPPPVLERCRRNVAEMKALMSSKNAYPDVDRKQVSRLTIPTLLLSGSRSVSTARFTDPELERLLPQTSSKRVVLQGATHIMWVQQPVESRQAVLQFIRSNRGPARPDKQARSRTGAAAARGA